MTTYTYNVHDNIKDLSLDDLRGLTSKDRLGFNVFLFNLEYDLNIGNIIRASHCLGVDKVIVLGNQKVDSRGCVGSHNYTEVQKVKLVSNKLKEYTDQQVLDNFKNLIEENKCFPILIEKIENSKSISDENDMSDIISYCRQYDLKPCLVFGNENKGIPDIIVENYKESVFHIEQRGVIRSMNVSSAASIAIHQMGQHIMSYDLKPKNKIS
jgi:tRNA G18 (ribose-2'-O)-methylase SpoU